MRSTTFFPMSTEAVRQEFARRLQRALIEKGWSQSKLARRAAPYAPDKRIIRDKISEYIRAKALPGPLHLACKARGKQPDELWPRSNQPVFDIEDLRDGRARMRIDRVVPMNTALQNAELLRKVENAGVEDRAELEARDAELRGDFPTRL